ncbi:type II toxin-antitoxin system RelE family toxin [Bifidobacterium crudilactis]|uniref:type II toxin-antitoxin system RelE family toxin n=1 Tax=Bifidobacterium crudilactis TaxID=327277 RepID=UPI000554BF33|nr:type II toxin-antitoxin system RelE/ParE family toxin [Bifidobacterium crudilactis]MCI2148943.1 type II toxin-antitoxin system RelE/ParE family toxin [Bifidobacterium crudilactis]MCI2157344.1 type II toxin-antitoxin system RelE/ParE family toxin [Bifidobacterium crudilactis]
MSYHVRLTPAALKQLRKMDRFDARIITDWITDRLEGCDNPRAFGKPLSANRAGEWRYRIGKYRVLCIIQDNELIVHVFSIEHRSTVYR